MGGSTEGGRGNPHKASPAAVERYLKGVHYPAQKDDLVYQAQGNGAPKGVMYVLNQFEDKNYNSTVDVAKRNKQNRR